MKFLYLYVFLKKKFLENHKQKQYLTRKKFKKLFKYKDYQEVNYLLLKIYFK